MKEKKLSKASLNYFHKNVVSGDTSDDKTGWTDCFESGARWHAELPILERLTDEERTKLKLSLMQFKEDNMTELLKLFRNIFGDDVFKFSPKIKKSLMENL